MLFRVASILLLLILASCKEKLPADYFPEVDFLPVVSNVEHPTHIEPVPGRDDLLLITEKAGKLKLCQVNSDRCGIALSLDVPTENELGLLSVSLHPNFSSNRKIYLTYTKGDATPWTWTLAEWQLDNSTDIDSVRASNETVLLELEQSRSWHTGGTGGFHSDGSFFIGVGDSARPEISRKPDSLRGKILRIDIEKAKSNRDYVPEIWASGFRNPWSFEFYKNNSLIVADVGEATLEEFSIVEKGKNYGWPIMEGTICYWPKEGCDKTGLTPPVYQYTRTHGRCIIGGPIYSGSDIPGLRGRYIFADCLARKVWSADVPSNSKEQIVIAQAPKLLSKPISTIAEGNDGEVYFGLFKGGGILRMQKVK